MLGVTSVAESWHVGLTNGQSPWLGRATWCWHGGGGICGTDLHISATGYKVTPPVVIGHEVCGFVEAVGAGVDSALISERLWPRLSFHLWYCRYCRNGRPNLCLSRKSIGAMSMER